jgi:ATP-dependent RNA helicase RhlE
LTFNDFNFDPRIVEGLSSMGYTKPTPIQEQSIPLILAQHDLIACAQTGTGKTASYLLPVMHHIALKKQRHNNTLILAPTRELAQQIDQQVEGLAYFAGISSIAVYGGGDGFVYEQQRRSLKDGVDIIIATPGRLIAQLASGAVKLSQVQHLILDEADRMLDMGFYDDIVKIISYLPAKRQTLLFSATMPAKIRTLARKILHNPKQINIALSQPAEGVSQQVYFTFDHQKIALIQLLLQEQQYTSVIIFASRKETVKKLDIALKRVGLKTEAFHSDLEQEKREAILQAFKGRLLPIIIGTDVLSRGIDVEGISLVINFDVPPDPEDYIHRIGRTARAETTGTAITFVNENDQRKFASIENLIGKPVTRIDLPVALGDSPVFNSDTKRKNNYKNRKRTGKSVKS